MTWAIGTDPNSPIPISPALAAYYGLSSSPKTDLFRGLGAVTGAVGGTVIVAALAGVTNNVTLTGATSTIAVVARSGVAGTH